MINFISLLLAMEELEKKKQTEKLKFKRGKGIKIYEQNRKVPVSYVLTLLSVT